MDVQSRYPAVFVSALLILASLDESRAVAGAPEIQFDMPAVVAAVDTGPEQASGIVRCDLSVSTLLAGGSRAVPIDHMLIQCRLRDRSQVADYEPKTELRSEYAGPISVTHKKEQIDSFGFNLDARFQPYGGGNIGGDDTTKESDAKQFERQAPMQAVVASGTTDRGRGVYFKLRWTSTQVLEGEKHFQVSFAVPKAWRGGLLDVSVTAVGIDRPMFGPAKTKPLIEQAFVVAVHRQHDSEAASIALRLARLDRELTDLAQRHFDERSSGLAGFWKKVLDGQPKDGRRPDWYYGVTSNRSDPYVDKEIRELPMPIRVAVLGYADAARELMQLGDAG